jgi:hypothetical protein
MGIAYSFSRCTPKRNNQILMPAKASILFLTAA